jgi:hypothetical protein
MNKVVRPGDVSSRSAKPRKPKKRRSCPPADKAGMIALRGEVKEAPLPLQRKAIMLWIPSNLRAFAFSTFG